MVWSKGKNAGHAWNCIDFSPTKYTGEVPLHLLSMSLQHIWWGTSQKKGKPIKIQGQNVVETQHCQGYLNGHKPWKPPWRLHPTRTGSSCFFYFLAMRPMGTPHFQPTSWRHCPRHVGKKWPHRPMFHYRIGINNIKRINTYQKLFKHCLQSTWYKTCSLQPGRLPGVDVPPSWFWSLMKINLMLLPHSTYWS